MKPFKGLGNPRMAVARLILAERGARNGGGMSDFARFGLW
jgi:hypothetical protein